MLAEWVERWFSTCPRTLRELGCLSEMLGIRRRYLRYHDAWQPHCLRSRQLILSALAGCTSRRKAVVFGSGWMHDVPLEELASAFQQVVLVDLFHPRLVRKQASKFPNVRLLACDVTGCLDAVCNGEHPLPRKPNSLFLGDPNLDLAISLNLLSQLPCMPERYLRDCRRHSPDEILTFCRGLVEEHLAYLLRLPGRVTLLSDVEVRTLAEAGQVISRKPTLYGVEFPWREHTWEWTLVPRRRAWPHRSEILQVVGIEDLGRTMRRIILPGQ